MIFRPVNRMLHSCAILFLLCGGAAFSQSLAAEPQATKSQTSRPPLAIPTNIAYERRVIHPSPTQQDQTTQSQTQPCSRDEVTSLVSRVVLPFMQEHPRLALTVGVLDAGASAVLGFGQMKLDGGATPDGRTMYEIGSITKVFTSLCLQRLVERGDVSLHDPVQKYLGGEVRMPAFESKPITLLHLSTHTSGLPRMPGNFASLTRLAAVVGNPYATYTPREMFEFLNGCKLTRAPESKVEYSNLGAGLLGLALARREKMPYEKMVRELVCEPLGLNDTVITLSPDQQARLAQATHQALLLGNADSPAVNWGFQECFCGAGALRSTANDMLRFLAANLGLIDTPLLTSLQATHAFRFKESDAMSMGLGWIRSPWNGFAEPIIWHNGGTGGYHAFIGMNRPARCAVVLLCNSNADGLDQLAGRILREFSVKRKP